MNAGIEINAVYEKFVSVFGFLISVYEEGPGMEAKLPMLSKVSIDITIHVNL
jgi:hypothetical protein